MSRGRINPDSGLTPQDERFAALIANGMSQSDAYRETRKVGKNTKPESIHATASKIASNPSVKLRIRTLCDRKKLQDIYSTQQWLLDVLRLCEKSEQMGNMTAAANFTRQIGQAIGSLREMMQITIGDTDDEALIEKLSGGDPHKAEMLKALAGKDDFKRA